VTVRVTTLKGAEAGRYYTDRLPGYYLDGDEPPGHWWGRGADLLGLSGDVDADAFHALLAGLHPATGARLGRRFGEGSVRGFDATFSAPKSVSVLFGVGDQNLRTEVTEAHDRAVEAVMGWVQDHAVTRLRHRGHLVAVDAEGVVAAVFRQHTSRRLDPQLHSHVVIANRVKAPDGRWLALDARTIKLDQRTLSALYHATLRTELTRRLGVAWHEPVHGIAEIAGIDRAVLQHFSGRTRDIDHRLAVKLERFRTELGREPTPRERWRLQREAALDSRPPKPNQHHPDGLHAEWRGRLEALGHDPVRLIAEVIGRQVQPVGISPVTVGVMAERALEALAECQSTWRPAQLVRELAAQVPTDVTVNPDKLVGWLDSLADHVAASRCVDLSPPVLDGVPVRRDGRPVTEMIIDRHLTTQAILDQEQRITQWVDRAVAIRDLIPNRRFAVRGTEGLSPAQAEACAAVAGGIAPVELIVGPAGAGKTTALAPAIRHLEQRGSAVFGVAPTAAAAEVLAIETGVTADTLDKLLHEHRRPDREPGTGYDLPSGATVILDEAGTVSTPNLARLLDLAERRQWRVVMVGDPHQFTAVGRGGMFAHLVDTYGAIELDRIHRFTHQWERDASLRLRTGDPSVLAEYARHGRLHGGTTEDMEAGILTAWAATRARGEEVAMMANTTDTVHRLNQAAQQARITLGELDPTGPRLRAGDRQLLVGDQVVTRRNDRTLRTERGVMVKNRDHWTIDTIHPEGTVTVTGRTGRVRLPAPYVAQHLELGYAQTAHATQGRTVDTALVLIDAPTDTAGVYTPMTRGRVANHAYVVTDDNRAAIDVLTRDLARHWIDRPASALRRHEIGVLGADEVWPSIGSQPELRQPAQGVQPEPGSWSEPRARARLTRGRARTNHDVGLPRLG
jgi:conjugative relaxase-like TrwC/TraI family protein